MQKDGMDAATADAALAAGVVALCVGNTRTRVGLVSDGRVSEAKSVGNSDPGAIVAAARKLAEAHSAGGFVLASVNKPLSQKLDLELAKIGGVFVIGRDLEIPIRHSLEPEAALAVGQDRLLDAVGAFARLKEACIIVDAGTAVTIDFVDGEGTFQGGVIAPGLRMMLGSLHSATSALPEVAYEAPGEGPSPFGKNTVEAIRNGVTNAFVGLVRTTVERFAENYGAFPIVVATGGDAAILEGDPVIDRFVPDLQMLGVAEVCRAAVEGGDGEPESDS